MAFKLGTQAQMRPSAAVPKLCALISVGGGEVFPARRFAVLLAGGADGRNAKVPNGGEIGHRGRGSLQNAEEIGDGLAGVCA
ncbi:hypothetical protein ACSHWI_15925, partial [Methylococcus sp. S2T]|uniref:hypothetical protein n=1 Tax=Methylococcus sp. S2T TaxID=3438967 RepID=UPI003ED9012D